MRADPADLLNLDEKTWVSLPGMRIRLTETLRYPCVVKRKEFACLYVTPG